MMGGMGENAGRYFLGQLLSATEHIHDSECAHRDLKLENLLIDGELNVKIADFGFATTKNVKCLNSYRGTKSYMSPEIWEQKPYDGMQSDLFALGVILFVIVHGSFPFITAQTNDQYYHDII